MSVPHDLQYITELARGAGKIILKHFGNVQRRTKTHAAATDEAVTDADRESQRFIVAGLRKRFPTDGIVGEENDTGDAITFDCPNPDGRAWVIDPIDGTNNFVSGFEMFGVCIGLLEKGVPTMGVVYDVCRDQMYSASAGQGAWLGNRRLSAQRTPLCDGSILMITSNLLDKTGKCPKWPMHILSRTEWKTRIIGTAALEVMSVAAGVAHATVTINGKLWDIAAPAAIALEAGATLTDLAGKPVFPFNLRGYQGAKVPFLCAGPAAHKELLTEIVAHP